MLYLASQRLNDYMLSIVCNVSFYLCYIQLYGYQDLIFIRAVRMCTLLLMLTLSSLAHAQLLTKRSYFL